MPNYTAYPPMVFGPLSFIGINLSHIEQVISGIHRLGL